MEDESVADLIREFDVKTASQATRSPNPFSIPDALGSFGWREENRRESQSRRAAMRKLTLVQRTDLMTPSIPSCCATRRATSALSGNKSMSEDSTSSGRYKMAQRMTEFIQQKREMYIVQMLIDKKAEQIQKISNTIKNEERRVLDDEQNIERLSSKYKMVSAHCEIAVARAKKRVEAARRERVEKMMQLKRKTLSVNQMKAEIVKNEDLVEAYRSYHEFLEAMTPDGKNMLEYFKEPQTLLDELAELEDYNYRVIDNCQNVENRMKKENRKIDQQIAEADRGISTLRRKISDCEAALQKESENFCETEECRSEQVESELAELSQKVRDAHERCFHRESHKTVVALLEEFESAMDDFYRQLECIDPKFVEEKQAIKDKQNFEKIRTMKQQKRQEEQERKKEQAIKRATRPVKKKVGRPVVPRSVPRRKEKKNSEKYLEYLKEQKRIEKMLYGSIHDTDHYAQVFV